MAEIKSFPNNQDEYSGAEDVMRWLHGRTSGVFAASGNAAVAALATPGMAVTVSDGTGWMSNANNDGVVWWNDSESVNGTKLQLTIDAADGVLNRIDRVVVEWKTTNYVDRPEIKVLKGTASSTAAAPALTNSGTKRQISLAQVAVAAGTTAITAGMITDERLNPEVCGLVTDTLSIDTSVINAQFTELLNQLRAAIEQAASGQIADGAVTAEKIAQEAVTRAKMAIDAFTLADNAGAHNAIYRGKNLGSAVTAAQWAAIQAGTFEDLFIGDYWTINGINWRIAAFDYYLASDMPDHHAVIVPDTSLYTAKMNASSTTSGGYAGSQMRTTNLATAKTTINNAFGSDHVLTFAEPLVNAVSSGMPSGISTYECTVELMTERQVYGSPIFSGCPWGSSTVPALNTKDRTQFPLFALNPYMASLSWYWLRDIVSDSNFACSNGAIAGYASAAYESGGVRPYFCIKA